MDGHLDGDEVGCGSRRALKERRNERRAKRETVWPLDLEDVGAGKEQRALGTLLQKGDASAYFSVSFGRLLPRV